MISQTYFHIQLTYGPWQTTDAFVSLPSLPSPPPPTHCDLISLEVWPGLCEIFKRFLGDSKVQTSLGTPPLPG